MSHNGRRRDCLLRLPLHEQAQRSDIAVKLLLDGRGRLLPGQPHTARARLFLNLLFRQLHCGDSPLEVLNESAEARREPLKRDAEGADARGRARAREDADDIAPGTHPGNARRRVWRSTRGG